MTELLTYKGRLPGVVVDVSPPNPIAAPLRLDVAGLVGFAERGPLDTPILVEDTSQYEAIFGGDLAVARDEGRPVYANLPRVAHGFFDNGGRRAYVVRVAGEGARPNEFHIPGLFTWAGGFSPVIHPAAWPGDWSDTVRIGTQLRSDPLRVAAHADAYRVLPTGVGETDLDGIELDLEVLAVDTIRDGDLLRLHFAGVQVYAQVQVSEPSGLLPSLHSIPVTVAADADHMLAFEVDFAKPADLPDTVERLDGRDWVALASAPLPDNPSASSEGFTLNLPVDEIVAAGDLLRLTYPDGAIVYLPVTEVIRTFDAAVTSDPFQQVTGLEALRVAALSRDVVDLALQQVDLLTFDLYIREGQATLEIWRERRFGKVPTTPADRDNPLTQQRDARFWMAALARPVDPERLWMTAEELQGRSLRLGAVPLLTDSDGVEIVPFYVPLGMSELQPFWHEPLPDDPSSSLPDSKNGLDTFDPEALLLDDDFDTVGIGRIMAVAEDLLYLGAERTKLTGVHSLLGVPEVALIAAPDALHRGWTDPEPPADDVPPDDEEEPEEPDLSVFDECPEPPEEPEEEPEPPEELPTPLEELFRLPVLIPEADYDVAPLIAVQQALINLCAARADIMAILSVPQHFDLRAVLSWQQQIAQRYLGFSGDPLSYAAAYHPWVRVREETTPELAPLRSVPPDGTVCGMIAARELARGPWIAPANESLHGAVGLAPAISQSEHVALFNQRINVLVQQPGRFAAMSAHTLSPDRLLLQISVRRLLIYVRKLLLREGHRWVFETNNARFRKYVQISLERMLSRIQTLGGLAAFQVVTGSEVNTPNDYDNGRFIVAIKLAPTTPIEFITVVLLRTGESLLEIIER